MRVEVTLDRAVYAPGDTAQATLTVRNEADTTVVLRFLTGQRYEFLVRDSRGAELWRWSTGMGFIQALGEERLEPGEALTYRERVPAPDAAGAYTMEALVTATGEALRASAALSVAG